MRKFLAMAIFVASLTNISIAAEQPEECVYKIEITKPAPVTALHTAALESNLDATTYLLKIGYDPMAEDYKGRTPIGIALNLWRETDPDIPEFQTREKIVEAMINHGCKVKKIQQWWKKICTEK